MNLSKHQAQIPIFCLAIVLTPAAWSAEEATAASGLTPQELELEAPEDAQVNLHAIPAGQVKKAVLEGIVEFGYKDENGRYVIDLFERDKAYLGVRVTTEDGQPVVGASPSVTVEGTSRVVLNELSSTEDGVMNFGVIGGEMGLDTVTATLGETSIEFAINVISLAAAGFPTLEPLDGGIGWDELMQAQLAYEDFNLIASFPDSIKARAGKTVKLSGFMMPLDPDLEQKHFLLTSNPPSCFFHIPGGPAGSVEILADKGIEVSWDPIVVEGRFEPLESSENGVVYRLVDARQIQQ